LFDEQKKKLQRSITLFLLFLRINLLRDRPIFIKRSIGC